MEKKMCIFFNVNEKTLAKLSTGFHVQLLDKSIFTVLKLHSFNFVQIIFKVIK